MHRATLQLEARAYCRYQAIALYKDDMRASMSTKNPSGAGSPIAKRWAFVGYLRNAENVSAEIWLVAPIVIDHARVSANGYANESHDRIRKRNKLPTSPSGCLNRLF